MTLLLIICSNVKANEDDFVIRVRDESGKGLSNVRIKIYATPKVEASPAIKFNANGGEFLDGTSIMYIRIPNNDFPADELNSSLSEEEREYFNYNIKGITKEGYSPNSFIQSEEISSNLVSNGMEFTVSWTENPNAHVITVDGNGETLKIGKKQLARVKVYENEFSIDNSFFIDKDFDNQKYFSGYDNNPSCSNYPYGIKINNSITYDDIYYQCSFEQPDGLYLYNSDDSVYRMIYGNKDYCFDLFSPSTNSIVISLNEGTVMIYDVNNKDLIRFTPPMIYEIINNEMPFSKFINTEKFKIVYQGESILESNIDTWILGSEQYGRFINTTYALSNEEENEIFYNYLNEYMDNCYVDVAHLEAG